jgi:hypothetical protein
MANISAKFSPSTQGIYPTKVYKDFPEDAIDIPEALYVKYQTGEVIALSVINGAVVEKPPAVKTTEQLIAEQLSIINRDSENAIKTITQTYPASEVLSWPKQEQEARAYLAGPAATPLIDALAEARNVDKEYLVEKIIEKSNQFAVISGSLIGKRQKLEDQLNSLPPNTSAENIADIKWE